MESEYMLYSIGNEGLAELRGKTTTASTTTAMLGFTSECALANFSALEGLPERVARGLAVHRLCLHPGTIVGCLLPR